MKKIKLLTSLAALPVVGGCVAITTTGCSQSITKVNITHAFWTTDGSTESTKLIMGTKYVLNTGSSTYDNASFVEEANNVGIYEVTNASNAELGYSWSTSSPYGPAITPTAAGNYTFKIIITLNKASGVDEPGNKYELSCPVQIYNS